MPLGQTVWSPTALLNAILKLGTYLAKDGLVVWIHAPCMFSISPPSLLDDRCRPTSTSKGGWWGDGNDWMSLQRETLNCGVLQQPIACL